MSRLCVTAAGLLGTAFVILATSCTNDFDKLFEADASSSGATDSGKVDEKDTGCVPSCSVKKKDDNSYVCDACACTCKIACLDDGKACSAGCNTGTYCDVSCGNATDCTVACSSGARCVLRCASNEKFGCDLTCDGGKRNECPGRVFTCGTPCPE